MSPDRVLSTAVQANCSRCDGIYRVGVASHSYEPRTSVGKLPVLGEFLI
jgi:hypothetical protein